jgi:hypothetical protein
MYKCISESKIHNEQQSPKMTMVSPGQNNVLFLNNNITNGRKVTKSTWTSKRFAAEKNVKKILHLHYS